MTEDPPYPLRRRFLDVFRKITVLQLTLGIIGLLAAGAAFRWAADMDSIRAWSPLAVSLFDDIGAALIGSAVVTGPAYVFITLNYRRFEHEALQFVRQDVEEKLTAIRDSITGQTGRFVDSAMSLQAMHQSGVTRLYASRRDALEDIAADLLDPQVRRIQLMAVSLNNFVRGLTALNEAWQRLENMILGNETPPDGMEIKVLTIDPGCFGATLRSRGESRTATSIAGRLETEATETAEHLLALQKNACRDGLFQFRMYQIPPIFFMCRTDLASYVQPYYFWPSRHVEIETPAPIMRYENHVAEPWTVPLHRQLDAHFDWLWDNAAIPGGEILDGRQVGLDRGRRVTGVVNVFDSPADALERILYLLEHAKKRVLLQGITLDSFFNQDKPLFEAVAKLVERKEATVRCLLLDPRSEQARLRAYREQLFVKPDMPFSSYSAELHTESALFSAIHDTAGLIVRAVQPRAREGFFEARLTASAPSCFMMLADDSLLVEQYHYGKINEDGDRFPVILGKQMPIVEFARARHPLYPGDPMRDPLRLLQDHFDFVFTRLSSPIAELLPPEN